jgi:hypothetical protein
MKPIDPIESRSPTMSRTMNITANRLRAGDLVEYGGRWHNVTEVVRRHGAAWPIARDGTGWAIALGTSPINVRRSQFRR